MKQKQRERERGMERVVLEAGERSTYLLGERTPAAGTYQK